MLTLIPIPSYRFDILLPTTYIKPGDPETTQQVSYIEVMGYLNEMTAKYKEDGGYTISNPNAPPPVAGVYQGGVPERNFSITLIVPERLFGQAEKDVHEMVLYFQRGYNQDEILCISYHVIRYMPQRDTSH